LINTPDLATYYRKRARESVIDLVFSNTSLVKDFHLLDEATGSDHEILGFNIINSRAISNINTQGKYNFNKADWDKFKRYLLGNLSYFQSYTFQNIEEAPSYDILASSNREIEFSLYSLLDRSVLELTTLLETASSYSIPRIRITSWSKPW
jgi:hypothetical protein